MVNRIFAKLSDDQRRALAQWTVDSERYSDVTAWPLTFLHRFGNLLVYLPFEKFQFLSRLQMLATLDVLLTNNLTTIQERFIIHNILKEGKAMSAADFERLGRLICSATTQDLIPYKQNLQVFDIIKRQLLNCIGNQIFVPNELVSQLYATSVLAESVSGQSG
uniref:putative stereocilin-like protein n=1 Tax=Pristiophorus japonicus TaxID=55135 RepID=UPI00398F526C